MEFYEQCYGQLSVADLQVTYTNLTTDHNDTAATFSDDNKAASVISGYDYILRTIKDFIQIYIVPVLCVLGILGNIVNIFILSRRRISVTMDCRMERAAYIGLIALAVSDLLFCASTLPNIVLINRHSFFYSKGFRYSIKRYGPYLQNSFSHISTWLTVVMATGRYAAICYPLHAKQVVHETGTKLSIGCSVIVWFALDMPRLWEYELIQLPCSATTNDTRYMYVLDSGYFSTHKYFRISMMYLWFVLGFFIPVSILAFCNTKLILSLRQSSRLRSTFSVSGASTPANKRVTPTLVAIVAMFIILVSPSEVANFLYYVIGTSRVEEFRLAIVITNALHTLNFAINFILYCVVNVHFRQTMIELCYAIRGQAPHQPTRRIYMASYSNINSNSTIPKGSKV